MEQRTVTQELMGEYRLQGRCHLAYSVQQSNPTRGVDIGYASGVDRETVECLRVFRSGVEELVRQRAGEEVEYVGIDIVIEFLAGCPASESAKYGYVFMYDVVEPVTELVVRLE